MEKIDKKQEVLDFVNGYIRENSYPPSIREICKAVNLKSTSSVHGYLQKLGNEGAIMRDSSKTRSIQITDMADSIRNQSDVFLPGRELVDVPILGNIAAGAPMLAVENIQGTFPIPVEYTKNSDVFMLKVRGDSMIDAGIFDGDFVVVKQQDIAKDGDKVVALIEDEATVKTFYREDNYYRLQPENQFMQAIIVRGNLKILGVVIGVIRFW
jgi:repressor LexA